MMLMTVTHATECGDNDENDDKGADDDDDADDDDALASQRME